MRRAVLKGILFCLLVGLVVAYVIRLGNGGTRLSSSGNEISVSSWYDTLSVSLEDRVRLRRMIKEAYDKYDPGSYSDEQADKTIDSYDNDYRAMIKGIYEKFDHDIYTDTKLVEILSHFDLLRESLATNYTRQLYDTISKSYDLRTYLEFEDAMASSKKRAKMYGVLNSAYYLPEFHDFDEKIIRDLKTSGVNPEGLVTPGIYRALKLVYVDALPDYKTFELGMADPEIRIKMYDLAKIRFGALIPSYDIFEASLLYEQEIIENNTTRKNLIMSDPIAWSIVLLIIGITIYFVVANMKLSTWKFVGKISLLSTYLLISCLCTYLVLTEGFDIVGARIFLVILIGLLSIMEWLQYKWKIYRYLAVFGLSVYTIAFYSSREVTTTTSPDNINAATYTISEYEEMLNSFSKNDAFLKNNFIINKRYNVFGERAGNAEYTELKTYSYFLYIYIGYLLLVNLKDVIAFSKGKMNLISEPRPD